MRHKARSAWDKMRHSASLSGGGTQTVDLSRDAEDDAPFSGGLHTRDAGSLAWSHWRQTRMASGNAWRRSSTYLFDAGEVAAVERMTLYGDTHRTELWLRSRTECHGWNRGPAGARTGLLLSRTGSLDPGNRVAFSGEGRKWWGVVL